MRNAISHLDCESVCELLSRYVQHVEALQPSPTYLCSLSKSASSIHKGAARLSPHPSRSDGLRSGMGALLQ